MGLRKRLSKLPSPFQRSHRRLRSALRRLPPPVRRPLGRMLGDLFERLHATRRSSASLPLLAFVALVAAGERERAQAGARRQSTSSAASPRTRRRLARLAKDAGMPEVSRELLASVSADPADLVALAAMEIRAGMYARALEHARRAADAGAKGAGAQAQLAEGRLAVLEPGWKPDLGEDAARLVALRGQSQPGRVLHLVAASLPYRVVGYTVRTQSVAQAQAGAGLDPHVATRAGFPGNEAELAVPEEQAIDGIPYHHLLPGFRSDRPDRGLNAGAKAAVDLLERLRPAVLQPASNYLMAQTAIALARPLGIPVVYEVRGFWEESWASEPSHHEDDALATDRYRMTRDAETAAMLEADMVVTLSAMMRQEIVERGCAPDRVVVVPNAVDHERFVPVPRDAALGRTLGIGPDNVVVGYVSSLTAYEGIPGLLEAVTELRPRFPNLRVLIVGDGADADVIRRAGTRLGLDDGTLVMPGQVPHQAISSYYSLIDVFVVPRTPSRVGRLVTPLKPFEAMALERAVLVSDLPALVESVIPGETALTYPAGDHAKLVEALGVLLDDPELRVRLGKRAREWVLENRTWATNGERYRQIFERLGVVATRPQGGGS